MARFMSNGEAIEKFIEIETIQTGDLPQEIKIKKIKNIQTLLITKLSFLVYTNAKKYRKYPNYEDLVQEGMIGLLRAVRKFNYHLFPNFFIYAERWIKHCIRRSASRFDVVYSPNRNRVVYSDAPESMLGEEESDYDVEEEYFAKQKEEQVRVALAGFTEREREIVEKIFGLNTNNPRTLRDVGPNYNLTHERIRQIKNEVLDKLKNNETLEELY